MTTEESKTGPVKKSSVGNLNFSTVMPIVDMTFWLKFTQKKLDIWKLEEPPIDVTATISMPMSKEISSSLVLNEASFTSLEETGKTIKTTGGLIEF